MKIKNLDISMLGHYMLAFRKSVKKSGTSSTFNNDSFDLNRLESYIAKMERDLEHVKSEPTLDLPKWHPVLIEMPDMPEDYEGVDNVAMTYVLRILSAGYFELLSSNSADKSNGLEKFDADRLTLIISRLKSWVAAMKDNGDIDLPELSNSNDE